MARSAEELSQEIMQLSQEQLTKFRAWYEKFDSDKWGSQIARDANSGKLDEVAETALKDHKAGKSRPI